MCTESEPVIPKEAGPAQRRAPTPAAGPCTLPAAAAPDRPQGSLLGKRPLENPNSFFRGSSGLHFVMLISPKLTPINLMGKE